MPFVDAEIAGKDFDFVTDRIRDHLDTVRTSTDWADVEELRAWYLADVAALLDAEGAVRTLQTALRQQIERWRLRSEEKRVHGVIPLYSEAAIRAMRKCADELESLLPALEPTP